jgi:hypothetical protein
MRISKTTIVAALAVFLAWFHLPPASAQDDTMVITPESYADMLNGTEPQTPPPPDASIAAPETYQPAQGYASERLPESSGGSTFSMDEIKGAGHRFFGKVSIGFAKVVEYAFQRSGRPNGYILGEEAGGAFVAGLRYGEGTLYTKDAGQHRVFWQGPSIGYDFGAAGSKTMVLVYNLNSPSQVYDTFAGVDGSAYFIGGVGITYLARNDVVLAPIRSGIGLRLGANIGYLKYTRQPTWNPF